MGTETIITILCIFISTAVIIAAVILKKGRSDDSSIMRNIDDRFDILEKRNDENSINERRELVSHFNMLGEMNARTNAALSADTAKSIENLRTSIEKSSHMMEDRNRLQAENLIKANNDTSSALRNEIITQFSALSDISLKQSREMAESNSKLISELKSSVENELAEITKRNDQALKQMRETVETRLSDSINTGLETSFKSVSAQLEQVYTSIGHMQSLTSDILDLKKVLGNIKNRGSWGEMQLGTLIADMLAPGQYEKEKMLSKNRDRVDYAVRLPSEDSEPVWLPVDSKFPMDKYAAVVAASEKGLTDEYQKAVIQVRTAASESARSISSKYILPPETTDFAVMFIPSEGLFSIIANEGLIPELRQKFKVIVAGPSTFSALLSTIQSGFRSFALRKNSEQIYHLLEQVRKSFDIFQKELEQAGRSLNSAQSSIERVSRSSGRLSSELSKVEKLEELDTAEDDTNKE